MAYEQNAISVILLRVWPFKVDSQLRVPVCDVVEVDCSCEPCYSD